MKKYSILLSFLLVSTSMMYAQEESHRFDVFLQQMPKPSSSLAEMMKVAANVNATEKGFASAYRKINSNLSQLYTPLYQRFKKLAAGTDKASYGLTLAEKNMLSDFKQGSRGLSEGLQFDFFKTLMVKRPLLRGGKPLWAGVNGQSASQELKDLEAAFDWNAFRTGAEKYTPKFGDTDENIAAINKQFTADLNGLPKKKVTVMEGFLQEMEDPDKAIALWKEHGLKRQKVFDQQYAVIYNWWRSQFGQLSTISSRLDEMMVQDHHPATINPALLDLQIRTWEALYQLTVIGQRLFNDALLAAVGKQQVEEMIAMYTKLKAGA